jgi:CcmD family protein
MKSYAFLVWGYLVVWVGLVTYFAFLGRRLAAVSRRIDALESRTRAGAPPRTT